MLRGIASLAVVLSHAFVFRDSEGWIGRISSWMEWGALGVPLFFVISGFCIHVQQARNIQAGRHSDPPFLSFWKRRFYRLYPSYFVALCFSASLLAVALALKVNVPSLKAYPEASWKWLGLDFLSHATMTHGFFPIFDKGAGNPPLWTIAREELLYLLYFPLLALRRRTGIRLTIAITLVAGIATKSLGHFLLGPGHPYHGVVTSSALALWFQWSLGALAAEQFAAKIKVHWLWKSPLTFLALFGMSFQLSKSQSMITDYAWGLCFFILVNYATSADHAFHRQALRPISGALAYLGIRSYSIYLFHSPIKSCCLFVLNPVVSSGTPLVQAAFAVFVTTCSVVAGAIAFSLLEKRFLAAGRTDPGVLPDSESQCQPLPGNLPERAA